MTRRSASYAAERYFSRMRSLRPGLPSALLLAPAALWLIIAAIGLLLAGSAPGAFGPVVRGYSAVSGSDTCVGCHPQEYRTWHASYHRTMTQEVAGSQTAAPFEGEVLTRGTMRAVMNRDSHGTPTVTVQVLGSEVVVLHAEVVLSVGSHRYQQYVGRIEEGPYATGAGELVRLPVAWHLGEARWIHMNDAFVEPQEARGDVDDWLRHLNTWNDNCVFCHNTQPNPGLQKDGGFKTRVGEYGIACESCHGPAKAHVARHRDPFRRVLSGWVAEEDQSITAPAHLAPQRAAEVCGRCHGQRIATDVDAVMRRGDGYIAGRDLSNCSRPIFRDSKLAGRPDIDFASRFWPDGTPRLSAYEYQGMLMSPCAATSNRNEDGHRDGDEGRSGDGGALSCGDCHSMHLGDPAGQLRPDRGGDTACLDCHEPTSLSAADLPAGHGAHRVVAPSVTCVDCHMPRTTYGLLEGLVSHRISVPEPGLWLGRDDQPDACTQCHVDRSRRWAADSLTDRAAFLDGASRTPERTRPAAATDEVSQERETWASRVVLDLYGGDPLQRGLAADALGRKNATGSPRLRAAWLVDGLVDEYASVRWMSWRAIKRLALELEQTLANGRSFEGGLDSESLAQLNELLLAYDPHGEPSQREHVRALLRLELGPGPFDGHGERYERLVSDRNQSALFIGE